MRTLTLCAALLALACTTPADAPGQDHHPPLIAAAGPPVDQQAVPTLDRGSFHMVTLYGRGAVVVHDDKHTYKPVNGSIQVPAHLAPALIAQGWSTYRPAPDPVDVPALSLASGTLTDPPNTNEGPANIEAVKGADEGTPAAAIAPVVSENADAKQFESNSNPTVAEENPDAAADAAAVAQVMVEHGATEAEARILLDLPALAE